MTVDDRIDWADVAAVVAVAAVLAVPGTRAPVASLLADLRREWCRDYRHGFVADVEHIAAALREAHEAGLRERIDVIDCDACGERHLTERGAAIVAENRALRRELVALAGRVSEALDVALCCGGIDGAHHKAWVIDQMVRHLAGDGYAAWVAAARDGEDGPETYSWDEGIAP